MSALGFAKVVAVLMIAIGVVLLALTLTRGPRSNTHLVLGIVFIIFGAARLRRLRDIARH